MKTILCYGDSNTYGFNPINGMRYPKNVRWPGRLQSLLGDGYTVIEEGCNGRTTVFDDPVDGWKNGLFYLKPCLNSHKPVDMVIMMLGSNDLKNVFHADAKEISEGAEQLVHEIYDFADSKQGFRPVVILVSPPEIGPDICHSSFHYVFDETAVTRSKEFPKYYKAVAHRNQCVFFDAAKCVRASEADSLHLMSEEHEKLAVGLLHCIRDRIERVGAELENVPDTSQTFSATKRIEVVAAVIRKGDQIFATQRGYGEFKDGWEFPGGKIESGETPQEALVREIREELDTEIEVGKLIDTVEYEYPQFHLTMHCFFCAVKSGDLVLKEHEAARWLTKETLDEVDWLPADVGLIEKLKAEL